MSDVVIADDSHLIHIDLGSCVSVILCGIDENNTIWFGVNHLFKSRNENDDMALQQVATIYNALTEKNMQEIVCLGLFGAGYRKNSLAKEVATKNVMSILEALNFYNLSIHLFQTGYSQGLQIIHALEQESILIKHFDMNKKEKKVIEIPLKDIFSKDTIRNMTETIK